MEGEQGSTKKLRFTEPDLRVIVGNEGSQKEYQYHAVSLALQSTYIDTMLVSPMKEGSNLVLTFPDIDPDTSEAMMKFLKPEEAYTMSATNAQKLAVVYDKYDFVHGRACCDIVFNRFFKEQLASIRDPHTSNHNYETLANMYQLAHDCHLPKSVESGTKYFLTALNKAADFTVPLLEKIGPLVGQAKSLELPDKYFWTPEKASLSSFPQDFMEWLKLINRVKSHEKCVDAISVTIKSTRNVVPASLCRGLLIEKRDVLKPKSSGDIHLRFAKFPGHWRLRVRYGGNPSSFWMWICQRTGDWEDLPPLSGWELCSRPHGLPEVAIDLVYEYC